MSFSLVFKWNKKEKSQHLVKIHDLIQRRRNNQFPNRLQFQGKEIGKMKRRSEIDQMKQPCFGFLGKEG